ncbi:hypothetical protein PSPO01_09353 [Paraphaeosphaeria sporulosa]
MAAAALNKKRPFSPALLAYLSAPETLHDRMANGSLVPDDEGHRVNRTERALQRLVGGLELADSSRGTEADKVAVLQAGSFEETDKSLKAYRIWAATGGQDDGRWGQRDSPAAWEHSSRQDERGRAGSPSVAQCPDVWHDSRGATRVGWPLGRQRATSAGRQRAIVGFGGAGAEGPSRTLSITSTAGSWAAATADRQWSAVYFCERLSHGCHAAAPDNCPVRQRHSPSTTGAASQWREQNRHCQHGWPLASPSVEAGRRALGAMNGSRQREASSSAVARGQWRRPRSSQLRGARLVANVACVRIKKEPCSCRAEASSPSLLASILQQRSAGPVQNPTLHPSFDSRSKGHRGSTAPLLPFRSRLSVPLSAKTTRFQSLPHLHALISPLPATDNLSFHRSLSSNCQHTKGFWSSDPLSRLFASSTPSSPSTHPVPAPHRLNLRPYTF